MTASPNHLSASPRLVVGRKVQALRNQGLVPANVYKKNSPSTAVTLDRKEFIKMYTQAGETGLIQLQVDGEKSAHPVLIRDVSYHPVSNTLLHVDFQEVDLKQKATAMIPVEVVGESQAIKDGAVLVVVYNEIEVEALPTDFPEKFELDLNKLEKIGDDIKVSDLHFNRSLVEISLDPDEVLVTVQAQEEEKVEEVVVQPAEVELTKQGSTKELAADGEAVSSNKTDAS